MEKSNKLTYLMDRQWPWAHLLITQPKELNDDRLQHHESFQLVAEDHEGIC